MSNDIPSYVKSPNWIIPYFGCCNKNARGVICQGSKEIDFDLYCKSCSCLYPINIFNQSQILI